MLDRYLLGDVDRVSPEAPIPVLRVERCEDRLGGAGNVAAMLAALSAEVVLVGVVGEDAEGAAVRALLGGIDVDADLLLAAPRPTTVKDRFLGRTHSRYPQQMIRVDRESAAPLEPALADRLCAAYEARLGATDLVVVSDYNKGVCAAGLLERMIAAAARRGVPVIADPVRGADYRRYAGCAGITPNRSEAALALHRAIACGDDGLAAARTLLDFGLEAAVVTLDREGIAWADRSGRSRLFPIRPRQVFDITGAGDMVLSALGFCLAAGADWPEAIEVANLAGGLEVERLGVVPVTREELLAELAAKGGRQGRKLLPLDRLLDELQRRRSLGDRVVMTNGCFDLLHPGHVASLERARAEGDCLVVGLNSDGSVRALKGPGRPILDEQGRAAMLSALECVDYVVLFDEPSVAGLVERVLPDVLVKSAQYGREEVVGGEAVVRSGGRVVLAPMQGDYSTTGIVDRIVAAMPARRDAA